MNRFNWKCLLIGAVVAVALSASAPQADAQAWGWYQPAAWSCGYTPCCSPCYSTVSCYSPCCYDSGGWYLGWRRGPVRRLLLGRYRWYWGGYSVGCCPTYDECCTDESAAPAGTPTPAQKPVVEPTVPDEPEVPDAPEPAMPEPTMPETSDSSAQNSGVLTVWVPYDAKVTVNGLETKSIGSRRQFVSFGLKPGFSYKYVVRAEVVRNGQLQEDTQTVMLTAGKITAVAFGFNTTSQQYAAAQ